VGGLHPKLRLSYYLDMFRGLAARHPGVHIKALTAVEVAHLARIEGMSVRHVLVAMQQAGVTSLPGRGGDVVSPAARAPSARHNPACEDALAHGDTVHLAGGAVFRVRRPRRHGGVRAGLPRSRGGHPDVAVLRSDRVADPRGGEGAGGARLALPDRAHVRELDTH